MRNDKLHCSHQSHIIMLGVRVVVNGRGSRLWLSATNVEIATAASIDSKLTYFGPIFFKHVRRFDRLLQILPLSAVFVQHVS